MPGLDNLWNLARRLGADASNTHCLHVSLLEAAAAHGLPAKKLDEIIPDSVVKPEDYFSAIIMGSEHLGMEVVRILASELLTSNPSVKIPDSARRILEINNGEYVVSCPNIRLMFRDNGRTFDCHAECDDNSDRAMTRIAKREHRGWFTGAIAEFKRR